MPLVMSTAAHDVLRALVKLKDPQSMKSMPRSNSVDLHH